MKSIVECKEEFARNNEFYLEGESYKKYLCLANIRTIRSVLFKVDGNFVIPTQLYVAGKNDDEIKLLFSIKIPISEINWNDVSWGVVPEELRGIWEIIEDNLNFFTDGEYDTSDFKDWYNFALELYNYFKKSKLLEDASVYELIERARELGADSDDFDCY